MQTIKLNDEVYKEFHILKKSEWRSGDYTGYSINDNTIKCGFLPGYGTTLFFENVHFLIIDDKKPAETFAIWRNHKVIGYCNITREAADKANGANNAVFYFGKDKVTAPEKYSNAHRGRENNV